MYCNFRNLSVICDEDSLNFSCLFCPNGADQEIKFIDNAVLKVITASGAHPAAADYPCRKHIIQREIDRQVLIIQLSGGTYPAETLELRFTLTAERLLIQSFSRATVGIEGEILWGKEPATSTFGVRLNAEESRLRSACGPAFSIHDNALFDRQEDRVLEFCSTDKFQVGFDWQSGTYRFRFESGLDYGRSIAFKIHEHFCRDKFHIPYAPVDKRHGFTTPPVGWMTWYALQFRTDAGAVIENARKLAETFGRFTDKLCIWVDWEWGHRAFDGLGQDGVDIFTPRPEAYPDGLAAVAAQIRALGLVPALWIGATNDGRRNRLMREHPEWVLARHPVWCGQWWVDPSHPGVIDQYIPTVFRQISDWGYLAVKWDCLPVTLTICDEYHDRFFNDAISSDTALRNAVSAAREVLGPEVYLLSCSGETERDITFAMDKFSAARIGGDVFGWEEFLNNSVRRVHHFYPWHNTVLYADADNLVLRREFNTPAQARSRVSFIGLTGLPVTIGDELSELDDFRIDLLKRIIPVADIHPMDLHCQTAGKTAVVVNLTVCKPFGEWHVAGIMNPGDTPLELSLNLNADLHISTGDDKWFAVYDFWAEKFLGISRDKLFLTIPAGDTTVVRLTPVADIPQLIFSSRHITQGGYELNHLHWDADSKTLYGNIRAVIGEPLRMAFYLPEQYRAGIRNARGIKCSGPEGAVLNAELLPTRAGDAAWSINF